MRGEEQATEWAIVTGSSFKNLFDRSMIVCATIVRNGMVLLVRQSGKHKTTYGHWVIPARRPEGREGLEEALRREMREELHLEVDVAHKIVEHIDPYTGIPLANFLCTPLTSEVSISDELHEARWFNDRSYLQN